MSVNMFKLDYAPEDDDDRVNTDRNMLKAINAIKAVNGTIHIQFSDGLGLIYDLPLTTENPIKPNEDAWKLFVIEPLGTRTIPAAPAPRA